jgi:DNA invertase Pin-like site-specific DNA recombinase
LAQFWLNFGSPKLVRELVQSEIQKKKTKMTTYKGLRELYESGQTIAELANYLEVSESCIYSRLKKSGVTMRNTGSRRTPQAQEALRNQMIQLRAQGLGYKKIAKAVGVTRSTVRRYLKLSTQKMLE